MSLEGKSPEEVAALASLSDGLLNDPVTRREYQRLLKKQNPKLSLPEIDTEDVIKAAVKPHVEAVEKMAGEREVEKAERHANRMYEDLRDERVVSSRKDFNELVKYASEKGFQTNDAGLRIAARHKEDEQRPAEPTPQSAAMTSILPKDNKDLMKDPTGWARNAANAAVSELQKNRGRAAA